MQRPFWECWPHIQHYALIEMDGFIGLAIGYHSYAQYISHYTCIITRNLVMTVCICEQITFEHTQRMYLPPYNCYTAANEQLILVSHSMYSYQQLL